MFSVIGQTALGVYKTLALMMLIPISIFVGMFFLQCGTKKWW